MDIGIAATDTEIMACYPVMRELRPHVSEADFLPQVRRQEQQGFRLALASLDGRPVGVAGFRVSENLFYGQNLYVDDLVTLPGDRSRGVGAALLEWLYQLAKAEGCAHFHLDSGVQRKDAHRFYEREQMPLVAYHFSRPVR